MPIDALVAPAGHETHARAAGQPRMGIGHEGGAAFLAVDHEPDPVGMGVKPVQHREITLARHAERVRHALGQQAFDQQMASDPVRHGFVLLPTPSAAPTLSSSTSAAPKKVAA